jgi:hypothetical protein
MSLSRCAILSVVALAALSAPAPATDSKGLEGWGDYKFGMTPEQVKKIPKASWLDLKTTEFLGVVINRLQASTLFEIAQRSFSASFYFQSQGLPAPSLQQLMFENKASGQSAASCEAIFLDLLRYAEEQHGAFQATTPAQPEKVESYGSLAIEWRNRPQYKSTYEVRDMKINAGEAAPAERTIVAQAVRPFGQSYMSVATTFNPASSECEFKLDINRGVIEPKTQPDVSAAR